MTSWRENPTGQYRASGLATLRSGFHPRSEGDPGVLWPTGAMTLSWGTQLAHVTSQGGSLKIIPETIFLPLPTSHHYSPLTDHSGTTSSWSPSEVSFLGHRAQEHGEWWRATWESNWKRFSSNLNISHLVAQFILRAWQQDSHLYFIMHSPESVVQSLACTRTITNAWVQGSVLPFTQLFSDIKV